jgi:hypothetical protein
MCLARGVIGAALIALLGACAAAKTSSPEFGEDPILPQRDRDQAASSTTETTLDSDGPTDADPDADADPNAPSPEDDPRMTTSTQTELVERFAPHVNLHPDDANRPANVDWYLARVTMRFHHDDCPDHEILGKGKVTQAALIAQTHEENKSFCRHDGSPGRTVKSIASDHFFLEVSDHATYKGAPRAEWKTYVVWRPKNGGLVDIEYWLFYPFNDGFSLFNHESDWEHVRVTIDPNADGGAKATAVKLSAHKGGTIMKIGDPRLTMAGGTHPVVYTAKGTHANYPKPGTYDIEGTSGVAKDTAIAAPAADLWKTESSTVIVGTRAAPKNGQVFVKYWGRWGELGDTSDTTGVTRHFP